MQQTKILRITERKLSAAEKSQLRKQIIEHSEDPKNQSLNQDRFEITVGKKTLDISYHTASGVKIYEIISAKKQAS